MLKTFTCIRCPNGCEVTIDTRSSGTSGNCCPKGAEYAREELLGPMRTIASSILVEGGDQPLVSVRLSKPIPKAQIFPVMEQIRKARVQAPVKAGAVLIANVLGLGSDVIATRSIDKE
ncbi:MAG: DUF1667 domain-containing protein [Sphaerochaetaceae bacterium]|nr:DUF1667 domain-containing protein [Spirochaetales bacterium]MDY5498884.1 DUF1667 domain-containing protein [Sphaerochaetaceae bacterium]